MDYLINNGYLADANILMASDIDVQYQSVFAPSFAVPDFRYVDFHKKLRRKDSKPTILFAPTYNDINFAARFLDVIDELKNGYRIIMHGHHLSAHQDGERNSLQKLHQSVDRVYSAEQYAFKIPLESADIVLTDNSSLIGDAIYNKVPVALFSKDPNEFCYRDISTIQYELVKRRDVLWTNDPNKIHTIVEKTLSDKMIVERQRKLQKELYPYKYYDPIKLWMEILNPYLENELSHEYDMTKKYWVDRINGLMQCDRNNQNVVDDLVALLAAKDSEIASHLGIKRSTRLLLGNIKRRIGRKQ